MTATATVISLGIGALAILGHLQVVITSAEPIDLVTAGGSADSMTLAVGTVGGIVGDEETPAADTSAALVRLGPSRLDDLCLLPRLDIPLLGVQLSLRLSSAAEVRLADVSIAAARGTVDDLVTPTTTIGRAGERSGVPGVPGGFAITSRGADPVLLGATDIASHGLVLEGGLRMSSLRVHPSFGELEC